MHILDSRCSGQRSCSFMVSDAELVQTAPCPTDFASYLAVAYSCISGKYLNRILTN